MIGQASKEADVAYPRSNKAQTRWYVTYAVPSASGKTRRVTLSRCPVTNATLQSRADADRVVAYCEATYERRPEAKVRKGAAELRDLFLASLKAQRVPDGTTRYYTEKLDILFGREVDGVVVGGFTKPIHLLKPTDLEALIAANQGWKARGTVKTILQVARRFIKTMQARGFVVPDFAAGIKAHGEETKESHAYTPEEIRLLDEAAVGTPLEVPIALADRAGLTLHDIRILDWSEVDLVERVIRHKRKKTGVGDPIPISPTLHAILTRNRAISGLVCRGLPETDSALYKALTRLMRAAWKGRDVPVHGWHSLRHTFLTEVSNGGATIAEVGRAAQHRHASSQTLKYVHAKRDGVRRAVEAADRALSGG